MVFKACVLLACAAYWQTGAAAQLEMTIVDDGGAPVREAVVALVPSSAGASTGPKPSVALDQVNKQFVPHVLAIEAGTTLFFPNSDNIRHQVYSFSDAKRFELKLYAGKTAAPVLFDQPGLVVIGCNIHDWMSAYVYVLATPYFAMTDQNGHTIVKAPLGSYSVQIWHPRHARGREPLTVALSMPQESVQLRETLALAAVDDSPGTPPDSNSPR